MKSSFNVFGIKIDIEVPDKKKKRKRAKALSAPRKDKMMRVDRIKSEPRSTEPVLK